MDFVGLTLERTENSDRGRIRQTLNYMLSNFAEDKNIQINFNFNDLSTLFLNVDLPDLSAIQNKSEKIVSEDNISSIKHQPRSQLKIHFNYLIHTIFLRVVEDIFSLFPLFQKIILSGNLQWDEYSISIEIDRQRWLELDYNQNPTDIPL